MIDATRTLTRYSPARQFFGRSMRSVIVDVASGKRLTTGTTNETHDGSRPWMLAVTPSITSEVLVTSTSRIAGTPGVARGCDVATSVRLSCAPRLHRPAGRRHFEVAASRRRSRPPVGRG